MPTASHTQTRLTSVAVVGLGYVGLPTALALHGRCAQITGIDASQNRIDQIAARDAELTPADKLILDAALADGSFTMTSDLSAVSRSDAVLICVPTPVDAANMPDLTALRSACANVVARARPGQVIILTSTSYVGTTAELLAGPLEARGFRVGTDVFVAFSPERIDPGNPEHLQRVTPRTLGGTTRACTEQAMRVLVQVADTVHPVSSPETAEASKLYENTQRAVLLALANEFADACRVLDLDPMEVTDAAATKPYSFMFVTPGPGVGGECIPCDPHYLLWQLDKQGYDSPLISQAMKSITARPAQVAARAADVLAEDGLVLAGAKVLIAGVSYKPGVRDMRQTPAVPLIMGLLAAGADVTFTDPLVPSLRLPDGQVLASTGSHGEDADLVIVHTVHPGFDYSWVDGCVRVLDATYKFKGATQRWIV
jgi:UDP-N-acetyl-D-glucosamine dehydrogenase